MKAAIAHAGLTARRVLQTPASFVNWPTLLGNMARQALGRGPDTLTFVARDGLTVRCPNRPGARVPVYEMFAEDTYRLAWLLGPLADRPITAIDIGGHVGTFAVSLARHHSHARISSYEPSPTTAAYLRDNVTGNGFSDRIEVVQAAVTARGGVATFNDNGAGSGQNGLAAAGHQGNDILEVRAMGFDDVIAAAGAPVDLVKIDCEGGEYEIVLRSSPASWATVSRVVIEFHPVVGRTWSQLQTRFDEVGLRVQHLTTKDGYGCVWLSREPLPRFPAAPTRTRER